MKQNNFRFRTESPPLVPQSAGAWFTPLAKAATAAVVLAVCYVMHAVLRQGQELSDTVAR